MYTIYSLTLIGIAIGLLTYVKGSTRNLPECCFRTGLGAFIGIVAGILSAMFFSPLVPKILVENEPITLVSMRNQEGVSGSFILGSGSLNSSMHYNFLMKQKDNSMVPGSVPSSEIVHFIEDPELKNTGYWKTTWRKSDPSHWLFMWTLFHSDNTRIVRQEFRVPVGSVIQQFNIK